MKSGQILKVKVYTGGMFGGSGECLAYIGIDQIAMIYQGEENETWFHLSAGPIAHADGPPEVWLEKIKALTEGA